jgi:hypothetical protein
LILKDGPFRKSIPLVFENDIAVDHNKRIFIADKGLKGFLS